MGHELLLFYCFTTALVFTTLLLYYCAHSCGTNIPQVRLGARDTKNGAYIRKVKATEDADEGAEQFRPRVVLGHRVARGAYIKGKKVPLYSCYYYFTPASFWATESRAAPILRVKK